MDESISLVITTAIAVYGALIATLSLAASIVLGVNELKRHRARLKVVARRAILIDGFDKPSEPFISVEAINVGSGSIRISSFGFYLRDKSKLHIINPYLLNLPIDVDERRKVSTYYAFRWFRSLRKRSEILGVYFQDETGKMWRAKFTKKQKKQFEEATGEGYLVEWNPSLRAFYRSGSSKGDSIEMHEDPGNITLG
jgi:hypothetical protein